MSDKTVEEMESLDLNGDCDFFRAINLRNYPFIEIFLKKGGNINLHNPYNLKTALFLAVDNCDSDMVYFLVRKGADIYHEYCGGIVFIDYIRDNMSL